MKVPRREFLRLSAGAAALPVTSGLALADTYPSRPVHILVGFTPGGPTDIAARLIAQWLAERLGQPFLVDNRPGAATNIATEAVAHAPQDGYTLLAAVSSNAINPALYTNLTFSFVRDIAMVAGLQTTPMVLEVNPSVPVSSVPELVAYAKANPNKLSLASFGTGTIAHVGGAGQCGIRQSAVVDRVHPAGQAARARRDDAQALACIAGCSGAKRISARL